MDDFEKLIAAIKLENTAKTLKEIEAYSKSVRDCKEELRNIGYSDESINKVYEEYTEF